MASVTADDWKNVMNLGEMDDKHAEYVLDMAIDLLNIYDVQLSNMSGTEGSKTMTLTSKERGGVFLVARAVYYSMYQNIETASGGGITVSATDLLSNPTVVETVEKVANRLQADNYERIPFIVAHDESGIS